MSADHYFPADGAFYARLCLITEVLVSFVSRAPRALSLEQLERQTARPAKELIKLCNNLCREGLLRAHPEQAASWLLIGEASRVTLEDAFRCAMAEQSAKPRSTRKHSEDTVPVQPEIGVLVTQAAMAINQSVFQHLRQFSLDRLKVATSDVLTARAANESGLKAWPPARLSFS